MKYALWLLVFCTLLLAPALSEVPPLSPEMQAQQSSQSQDEVTFTYWQAGKRPPGWVGPGGQYQEVPADTVVRVYLIKEKTGYRLLSPNGWEKTEGKS